MGGGAFFFAFFEKLIHPYAHSTSAFQLPFVCWRFGAVFDAARGFSA